MKLSKIFFVALLSIPTLSFAAPFDSDKYTPAQHQQLKESSGVYVDALGNEFEVVYATEQNDQGDLFGPRKFDFYGTSDFRFSGIYFDLNDWTGKSKNALVFESAVGDCDDPGCVTWDAKVSFTKNSSGKYEAFIEAVFVADAEDVAYEAQDTELEGEELKAYLNNQCVKYYGKTASLAGYNGKVYCQYEVSGLFKRK